MSENYTEIYRTALAIMHQHREVKWTGWRRLAQAAAHNQTAYMDGFCVVCQTAFPCQTYLSAEKIRGLALPGVSYPM